MDKETYCLCGQPYNVGQFMIECDCCREWFHGSCVEVKIYQSDDIDKYHCPKCSPTYGPSILKVPTNEHRQDRYEVGAEARPAQAGAPAWSAALAARPLRPNPLALQQIHPHQFTEDFVRDGGFTRPVFFQSSEGLGIQMPTPSTFTVRSVLRYCGANLEVEVIDVRKQATLRMPLGDIVDYLETRPEHRDGKLLNVLSLEFSDTSMSGLVTPPALARKLDWAECVWPMVEERPARPAVQKYCLMSAAGSFTDFHVDFGGTSVWYHVLHGRKIFYLIPPTATNLALYQQWNTTNSSERFFGDLVEWYATAEVLSGQTVFIPTGWIHAVLTPEDSLVFGGNFLHSYAIELQLQINEIERRVDTPMMFRYPLFETMHWYAGAHLLALLRRHNEETQDEDFTLNESRGRQPATRPALPPLLVRGIRILTTALKEWQALKSNDTAKRDNIPKCLNSSQLVRELSRELRKLDKHKATPKNTDKDYKPRSNASPSKLEQKVRKVISPQAVRKPLKLTLPKPIMHMGNGQALQENRMVHEETMLREGKTFIEENKYGYQDMMLPKTEIYTPSMQEGKAFVDDKEVQLAAYNAGYVDYAAPQVVSNGYVERDERKGGTVLRIKLGSSPSSSREQNPPAYALPEHSILKSHLIGRATGVPKPVHQWTISKKDTADPSQEEQILFTNENVVDDVRSNDLSYGPGMYSAEDLPPDFQYSETAKPGSYQPDYSNFQNTSIQDIAYTADGQAYAIDDGRPREYAPDYERKFDVAGEVPLVVGQEGASFGNGYQLPSYEAAVSGNYGSNYSGQSEMVPEMKTESKPAVRRSERPVRRRVSATYDYEDGELYIDETPAPARRRPSKPKHRVRHQVPNYRQPQSRPPANGIESLIQASVLAETDNTEDTAVAGMLSIGRPFDTQPAPECNVRPESFPTNPSMTSKRARKPPPLPSSSPDRELIEEKVIKEVHRDEDFVYTSLEMSSDEEMEWSAGGARSRRRHSKFHGDVRGTKDKDESWSPRARVGRLVPRLRGPVRSGVKREAVRKALQAAANTTPPPVPPVPPAPPLVTQLNGKRAIVALKNRRPQQLLPPTTPPKHSLKPKKGMKTPKQRLGKILKIHKMIY